MSSMFAEQTWQVWVWTILAISTGIAIGLVARRFLLTLAQRLAKRTKGEVDDTLIAALRGPSLIVLPAFAVQFALTAAPLTGPFEGFLQRGVTMLLVTGLGWIAVMLVDATGKLVARRYTRGDRSAFARRAVETRIHLITRMLSGLVIIIAGAIILMSIPALRQLGASILASAGIAGIVAGLAARSILANLFAGIQLALAEPVRIGDAVVIEKEFGTIERIGSSFVIVKLWDLRRLIVPLNYFLENRFENWTYQSSELLGTVVLHVDFQVPLDQLREELTRIVESSPNWDRQTVVMHVTDVTQQTVQVRALVSAADPSKLWELRCEVREKLVSFLQTKLPQGVPKLRAELATPSGNTDRGNGAVVAAVASASAANGSPERDD